MKLKQNSHYNRFILEIISPYTSYAKIFTLFYSCFLTELEVEASVENASDLLLLLRVPITD